MAKNTEAVELTTKQIVNEGIIRATEALGVEGQKNRYKAMRAIAYQAFANAIADGTFDDLIDEAVANADELPAGWELERAPKAEAPVRKAPAKKAPAKKAPAKTARRRPTR